VGSSDRTVQNHRRGGQGGCESRCDEAAAAAAAAGANAASSTSGSSGSSASINKQSRRRRKKKLKSVRPIDDGDLDEDALNADESDYDSDFFVYDNDSDDDGEDDELDGVESAIEDISSSGFSNIGAASTATGAGAAGALVGSTTTDTTVGGFGSTSTSVGSTSELYDAYSSINAAPASDKISASGETKAGYLVSDRVKVESKIRECDLQQALVRRSLYICTYFSQGINGPHKCLLAKFFFRVIEQLYVNSYTPINDLSSLFNQLKLVFEIVM
jgi:hypothetical protein